uniref:Uncharacterized protein n=1 Tax=Avena sativa TaxID=4498 RepID=A0ACD5ZQE8_AVESA
MDRPAGNPAGQMSKKERKKLKKEESDRRMLAEKKRRRLEKALANSAAIISELEKKRQQKQEEQQRLDAEGAAIAEAVALHVLIGEDCDEPHQLMWNDRMSHEGHQDDLELTSGTQGAGAAYPAGSRLPLASASHVPQWRLTDCGMAGPFSFSSWERLGGFEALYREGTSRRQTDSDTYHGVVATRAVEYRSAEDEFHAQGAAAAASSVNIMFSGAENSLNIYRREF